jgi:outer membrane biosynthesis protein TonB
MFWEGHVVSGVFNAPNQTTTATHNLAIPTNKPTTTGQAKLQRKSQNLQKLPRQPTTNKIQTNKTSHKPAQKKNTQNKKPAKPQAPLNIINRNETPIVATKVF